MHCDFSERVSLLIDRELSPSEAEQMRQHVSECRVCQQVEQDFLGMRHQIKSYDSGADPIAQRQMLWRVLSSQTAPFWRRKIALPAPIFALLMLLLMIGAWSLIANPGFLRSGGIDKASIKSGDTGDSGAGAVDLSRFDHGERATLYIERKPDVSGASGKGASQ